MADYTIGVDLFAVMYTIVLLTGVYKRGSNSLSNDQYIVYDPSVNYWGIDILKYVDVVPIGILIIEGNIENVNAEGFKFKLRTHGDSTVTGTYNTYVPLST